MDRDQKPKDLTGSGESRLVSGFDESFLQEEDGGMIKDLLNGTGRPEEIIIDGRVFREGDKVFDLEDVVEEKQVRSSKAAAPAGLDERVTEEIRAIAERVARELIPDIAERVIREEIAKLKRTES